MSTTITTTVWVVRGVHDHTTNSWADTLVAAAAGFADFYVLVLLVAKHANAGGALNINQTHFAAGQAHLGVVFFFGH